MSRLPILAPKTSSHKASHLTIDISVRPRKIFRVLFLILALTVFTGIVAEILDLLTYSWAEKQSFQWYINFFNLDREFNFPAIYSSFLLLFSSVVLWVISRLKNLIFDNYSWQWKLLSYIFLYLALDELLSLHELLIIRPLREALSLGGIFHQTWVIPGTLLVIYFIYKYWHFFWDLPLSTRRQFFLAGSIYISGALGMEMVSGLLYDHFSLSGPVSATGIVIEESLEMLGINLFLYSLIHYLQVNFRNIDFSLDFKS